MPLQRAHFRFCDPTEKSSLIASGIGPAINLKTAKAARDAARARHRLFIEWP
jgi:hypothetical protein